MVEVRKYHLPPTALIPNSPHPLLHYPGILSPSPSATTAHDLFTTNAWRTQWIFRYGTTQTAHYHSAVHECMAVLSGSATIRFGVADTSDNLEESTRGGAMESGGIELHAEAGDVFVLPAGTAHKTFDARPEAAFKLLTPGDGHCILRAGAENGEVRRALEEVELDGFTMIGAYPVGGGEWDFAKGGENQGEYEKVWEVKRPEFDPVLGKDERGLVGLWR